MSLTISPELPQLFQNNHASPHPTKFGTFNVKKLEFSDNCRPLNKSIYPSTFTTLTPSSELHHKLNINNIGESTLLAPNSSSHFFESFGNKGENNINYTLPSSNIKLPPYYTHPKSSFFNKAQKAISQALCFPFTKIKELISHDNRRDYEHGIAKHSNSICLLSVSYQRPTTFPIFFALFYSYFPLLGYCLLLIYYLFTFSALLLFAILLCSSVCVVNELVVKKLLKEPRPKGSSVHSYGMPSSHCMVSYTFLTWFLTEFTFKLPSHPLPLYSLIFAIFLLLPVPWARLYLNDHSLKQCCVGSCAGIVLGILAFFVRYSWYLHKINMQNINLYAS